MRIKRIEIIGFKSFQDKTVLTISEPITAVVGPNGCGKSNIIDAIRWCMGEQSAKHLRGKAMDDVIFGGSETRAPAGLAEVSLTFEDVGLSVNASSTQPELPGAASEADEEAEILEDDEPGARPALDFAQYGEVTVTRRLYRDGGSEYFINKTPCRLRDIVDFFLGTGVGTKAYSIIEQGRVGMIVSAKPEDRRMILEEAAGITKFKKKKQAAERKMELTRANLLRVTDIVAEIEKQLASLRRQAQKAERYKKYRAEVRDIELWSAAHRFLGVRAEASLLGGQLEEAQAERGAAETAHESADGAVVAARAESALEERRLQDLTQQLFDAENRVKLGESQVEFQAREARDLEERSAAAGGEVEALRRQLEETRVESGRVAADAERLDGEAARRVAELGRLEADLAECRGALGAASGALDGARTEIGKAQADIARHENNVRSLDRRRGDLELRVGRLAEEEGRVAGRSAELLGEVGRHEERLGTLRLEKASRDEDRAALEVRKIAVESGHAEAETEARRLESELTKRRSRLSSLVQIQSKFEGFARGTRAIMKHRQGQTLGLVADLLRVPAELEVAVEAVLGERLGAILVASQAEGVEAIGFLKEAKEGRSTFVPLDVASAEADARVAPGADALAAGADALAAGAGALAAGSDALAALADAPPAVAGVGGHIPRGSDSGVRGRLVDLVSAADGHAGVAAALLGDVLVVDTLAHALALWQGGGRQRIVTLDGDVVDAAGSVTGGSRDTAGAGVLAQKREIRELEELCARLAADHERHGTRAAALKQELRDTSSALEALRRDSHQGDLAILTSEKDLARWKGDAERLAERRAQLARERAELDAALRECEREAEETTVNLARARGRADDAERLQLGLIEGVTIARRDVDDAGGRVTEHKIRVAQAGAEKAAVRAQLGRLDESARDLGRRIDKLERTAGEGSARAAALRAEAAAVAAELDALRATRRGHAEALAAGRAAHEERLVRLQEQELAVRALRQKLDKLGAEAARLELRLSALDAERRHVEESIAERYRLDLTRELHAFHLRPPIGEADEAHLRELKELIERMGEINLTAIEEFEEQSKRFELLGGQKRDLEAALEQLERAIAKINKVSRRRFRETFEAVNAKFKEIFPRLFRGGRAELRLVGGESDEEILDAGIEIIAQPPGKKNTSVELLSGGEKALTAVSMIFAIFLIKPSPFCILDEVDAPLDEANVGRYNDMVREMTDRSQFIVITHNKRTMEIADTLFGITMEEPGCSKLVNVNLRTFGEKVGDRRAA
jgi:chromosome segregation protein